MTHRNFRPRTWRLPVDPPEDVFGRSLMQHGARYAELSSLDAYRLVDANQDIRGRAVVDPLGEHYGVIRDLLVGSDYERVSAIRLENGRICAVELLEIHDEAVVYGPTAAADAADGRTALSGEIIAVNPEQVGAGKRAGAHGAALNARLRPSSHLFAVQS